MSEIETTISIIGTAYFQPISDLLEKWLKRKVPRSDKVSSGYYEGAYAVSLIILLVSAFESFMARERWFRKDVSIRRREGLPEIFKKLFPKYRRYKRLSDVYVVRDSIVHNHLWEIDSEQNRFRKRKLVKATQSPWDGNTRYKERINLESRRTKALSLHTVPTRIDRRDALKVMGVILDALMVIETCGAMPIRITESTVGFQGGNRPFKELYSALEKAI